MAIDALFRRGHLDDGVHIEHLLLLDVAVDGDGPGTRLEILCQAGRLVLVGGKFVVVVVVGDVFVGRDRFGGGEWTLLDAVNLGVGLRHRRGRSYFAQAHSRRHRRCARQRRACQKLSPVQVQALRGDLGRWNVGRFLDQHEGKLLKGYAQTSGAGLLASILC